MTEKIYLDACIFTAFAHQKHPNHILIKNCISSLLDFDIEVFSSEWALIEMNKTLIRDYHYSKDKAKKVAEDFKKNKKFPKINVIFIDIDSTKSCNFKQFFDYIKNNMIEVKEVHLADAIHSVIMSNNGIRNILTTDTDFKVLEEVISINPNVFTVMKPKRD